MQVQGGTPSVLPLRPPVKMGHRNVRRCSGVPKFKMIFPLNMAKAHAEAIPNRFTVCVYQNIFSQVA